METTLLWLVFSSGLMSSTLLPGNSEIVFTGALLQHPDITITLLMMVTLGNTLGGVISWGMGRLVAIRFPLQTPDKPAQLKAIKLLNQWGAPILLLSWMPVIGDPLCAAAGWIKTAPLVSFLFIGLGKLVRYVAVAYAVGIW